MFLSEKEFENGENVGVVGCGVELNCAAKSKRCLLSGGPITLNKTGKNIRLCNVPNAMIPKYIRK